MYQKSNEGLPKTKPLTEHIWGEQTNKKGEKDTKHPWQQKKNSFEESRHKINFLLPWELGQ